MTLKPRLSLSWRLYAKRKSFKTVSHAEEKDKDNRDLLDVLNDRYYLPVVDILYDNIDDGNPECHKSASATGQ